MAEAEQQTGGRGGQYLLTLVFVVIGFFIGSHIDAIAPWLTEDLSLRLWHLLLLPIWFFVSVMVHEGGHFVAGRLAGLQWMTVTAGPLRLTRLRSGVSVQWFRNDSSIGGLVLMVPGTVPISRTGWAAFVLGGPVANLLFSAVLIGVLRVGVTAAWQGPLLLLALVSLFLGVLNLLPFRASGFSTDGRNLLDILRDDATYAVSRAMLAIAGHSAAGVRPREWNSTLVAQVREFHHGNNADADEASRAASATQAYILYLHALDAGDREAMRRYLADTAECFEALPSLTASPVACALAIHFRLIDADLAAAEIWHEKGRSGLTDASMLAVADFSRAYIDGDINEARRLADHARRCMAEDADQGGVLPYRDLLERIVV
ncbi:M50 family metallopeptidase [Alcanivorax sp. JB21]|uniref:M50 family metallopeptidase n=1 Tax=Alcanivorax limicola TaxID=2874102 RepID=UPI001CBF2B96|nr:M50 family metallopeptidase [Alcanivorax limicola]MBZ2187743.1 M50 family metallopeptidase [Alcanivorax limicola]